MSGSIQDSEFDDTWVPPQDKSQDQYEFIWKPPWRKFNIRVCFPDGRILDHSSTYLVPLTMQFLISHHLQRLQQMIRDIRSFHVESILLSEELLEIKLKSNATEKILSEIEIVLANECDDITTRMVRKFPFTSNLCEDLFKKSLKEQTIDLVCDEANIFIVGHSKMKDLINQAMDEISRVSMENNYVLKEAWQIAAVMKFQMLDEIAKTFSDLIISPQEGKCSVYFHGKDETVKKAVKELERLLSDLFVEKVECDPLIIKLLICSDASEIFTAVLKKASADVVWVVDDGKLSLFSKYQINSDLVRLLLCDNFMSVGFSGMTGKSFVTSKAFTDITKSSEIECIVQEKSASGINISSTKKVVQELLRQEKLYYEYTDNSKETQVNTTDEEISNLRTTNKEMEKRLSHLESQLRKEISLKQVSETKLRHAEEKNSREFESKRKLQEELIAERLKIVRLKTELKEKETTIVDTNTEIQRLKDDQAKVVDNQKDFHTVTSFARPRRNRSGKTQNFPSNVQSEEGKLGPTVRGGKLQIHCVICMDTPTDPKKLQCGHIFCGECIALQFKVKPVCPTCGSIQGVVTGDQPPGTINVRKSSLPLTGYPHCGRIEIEYNIYSGKQGPEHPNPGQRFEGIKRTAYLPDNGRGQTISKLLQIAFKRKLVFTIGHSRTTGKQGVVTWNDIHHKTDHRPHTQFGYPDDTYLDRVIDELAIKGVTEKDL